MIAGPSPNVFPRDQTTNIIKEKQSPKDPGFFTHFIYSVRKAADCRTLTNVLALHNRRDIQKIIKVGTYGLRNSEYTSPQTPATSPSYSPCIIEEILRNHKVRTNGLRKSEHTSPKTPATSPTYSPCIIEEILKNHKSGLTDSVSPGTQVRRPPQLHQPTTWT